MVSIITPVYNCDEFLEECIQSVLNQTFHDWELILIDDFSSDSSKGVINKYVALDSRIKAYYFNENVGAGTARNKGIEISKGRFIAFLDSDDNWLPEKLERQLEFMISNNYNLTHTSYELIDHQGNSLNKTIVPAKILGYKDMLYSNKIGCLTAIYNQRKIGKKYMPLLRKRQDYALWLKILKTGEKAYGLAEVLSQYRNTENSISNNKLNLIKWNWKLLREVENLSFIKSVYYLSCNIIFKFLKR